MVFKRLLLIKFKKPFIKLKGKQKKIVAGGRTMLTFAIDKLLKTF